MEAAIRPEPLELTVLGVHLKSDGYPNVTWRIEGMAAAEGVCLREIGFPFRARPGAGRPAGLKPLRLAGAALRLGYAHLRALCRYYREGAAANVYLPYPAVFLLFWFSLLPARWRPRRLVADAFISLYDTVVEDRGLLAPGGLLAGLLRRIEGRAYRAADWLVVDTALSARYFVETFGLDPAKVEALPLAIDEAAYRPAPYRPAPGPCTVLFVGTFVPLQGVEVIVRAARLLGQREDIRFRLVGDGQTAAEVERLLAEGGCDNLTWLRTWQGSARLAEEVRQADICLGIFGSGPKAGRVWPIKNYAYMAVGRAVITGDTPWAESLRAGAERAPFLTVPPGDPEALAAAIRSLADDPGRRARYAERAQAFYRARLAAGISVGRILDWLRGRRPAPSGARNGLLPEQQDHRAAQGEIGSDQPQAEQQAQQNRVP